MQPFLFNDNVPQNISEHHEDESGSPQELPSPAATLSPQSDTLTHSPAPDLEAAGNDAVEVTFPDRDSDSTASSTPEDEMSVKDLAREWYLIQLGRVCSNEVSSDHWDFAWKYCDVISELKKNGKLKKFPELTKKVLEQCAPKLKMDYIFKDKSLPDDS